MCPFLTDVTCPYQFLAAIVVREDAEDQDEDGPPSALRGEPLFNVVGTVSALTKEKVGNFLHEYYTVSVARAACPPPHYHPWLCFQSHHSQVEILIDSFCNLTVSIECELLQEARCCC